LQFDLRKIPEQTVQKKAVLFDNRCQSILRWRYTRRDGSAVPDDSFPPALASSWPECVASFMKERRLLVMQGGGPSQVFNATLAAIVAEVRGSRAFTSVLGARGGMKGLAEGRIGDLTQWSIQDLERLRRIPGAVLGSSRTKLSDDEMALALAQLRRLQVHDLLLVGGNGTMRGAQVIAQYCGDSGCDLRVLGVPKTVDNDIAGTDRCPGYASAARYIAQSTCDLGADVRSLPQPVSILETMGRNVGWLAAAAAAGKRDEEDAPHIVCLPERPFGMDHFLSSLDAIVTRQGWAIVVVSEGIRGADGELVFQNDDPTQADPLRRPITGGVAQFLAEAVARHLKIRCRSEKPGLLGRASMRHVSPQDLADAEDAGRAAVRGLISGETGKMVSLQPIDLASGGATTLVSLANVAGLDRPLPGEWLTDCAIPLTQAFFDYLKPLIGELLPHDEPPMSEFTVPGDVLL
jgi:ATP-dependent phosphofructokinase / diphosphate-dependent phosphofructokinase